MAQPSTKYGEVFEYQGVVYVRFAGGALLLSHASERAEELGRPCIVTLDGRECLIKGVGPSWLAQATLADVRRIAVY